MYNLTCSVKEGFFMTAILADAAEAMQGRVDPHDGGCGWQHRVRPASIQTDMTSFRADIDLWLVVQSRSDFGRFGANGEHRRSLDQPARAGSAFYGVDRLCDQRTWRVDELAGSPGDRALSLANRTAFQALEAVQIGRASCR